MECCVCLESYYVCLTPCKHPICIGCLLKINKLHCPICRRILEHLPINFKNKYNQIHNGPIRINDVEEFPPLQ